jgi:hypothetical protein
MTLGVDIYNVDFSTWSVLETASIWLSGQYKIPNYTIFWGLPDFSSQHLRSVEVTALSAPFAKNGKFKASSQLHLL